MFGKNKKKAGKATLRSSGRTMWLILAFVFVFGASLFMDKRVKPKFEDEQVQSSKFKDFSIVMDCGMVAEQIARYDNKKIYTFTLDDRSQYFDVYAVPVNELKYGKNDNKVPFGDVLADGGLTPDIAINLLYYDLTKEDSKVVLDMNNRTTIHNDGEYLEVFIPSIEGDLTCFFSCRYIIHDGWLYFFRLTCDELYADEYADRFHSYLSSIVMAN